MVPMKFGLDWSGAYYNCFLSVYNGDGSVVVKHGGVEIGQGIDMKVQFQFQFQFDLALIITKCNNKEYFIIIFHL